MGYSSKTLMLWMPWAIGLALSLGCEPEFGIEGERCSEFGFCDEGLQCINGLCSTPDNDAVDNCVCDSLDYAFCGLDEVNCPNSCLCTDDFEIGVCDVSALICGPS